MTFPESVVGATKFASTHVKETFIFASEYIHTTYAHTYVGMFAAMSFVSISILAD